MMSAFSFLTMAGGVALGTSTANQRLTSTPGNPASAKVGTSGSPSTRLLAVTASPRRAPLWMYGTAVEVPTKNMATSPASSARSTGAAPRQRGKSEKCRFTKPSGRASSRAVGSSCPNATTTPASARVAATSARAVVLESAVATSFCAGADLKERNGFTDQDYLDQRVVFRGAFDALRALVVPTIAAVRGYALGGGFELALCCDLIVADETAVLGLPDDRLGERVVSVVEPAAGATVDAEALRDHCLANLAKYKVPERFVVVDQLPRNAMGKIVRKQLPDLL